MSKPIFKGHIRPGEEKTMDITEEHIIIECPFQHLSTFQAVMAWLLRIKVNEPIQLWSKKRVDPNKNPAAPPAVFQGEAI
jgi:hypothetical protein